MEDPATVEDTAAVEDTATDADRRRSRTLRTRAIVAGACVVALAVGGAGLAVALAPSATGDGRAAHGARGAHALSTAEVVRGTLQGTTSASGTLTYAGSRVVGAGTGGVVTALPDPGTRIRLGEQLYAVDNRPVTVLYGGLPAWRGFEAGMQDGPDVMALEESLAALGHFDGEPDSHFSAATASAIRSWQKATGQEVTGAIPLGAIVFSPGELRVAEALGGLGDRVAPGVPLVRVTDPVKEVTVPLKPATRQLAAVGAQVGIDLPGGATTTGTVSVVGPPTDGAGAGGGDTVIPVAVALDDPDAVASVPEGQVTVRFSSERRENVLSVPVGALLALDDETFGVEVVVPDGATRRIPVVTGLFAGGRVEVSGDGIEAGQRVVVPTV